MTSLQNSCESGYRDLLDLNSRRRASSKRGLPSARQLFAFEFESAAVGAMCFIDVALFLQPDVFAEI